MHFCIYRQCIQRLATTNPDKPTLHQYYTRSKARAIVEDQARVERLEKANQELQEKHAKSCDDISQMMKILKMLTKDKKNTEAPNPQAEAAPLRNTGENILYPQGFTFPRETQTTYAHHHKLFPLTMDLLKLLILPEWSYGNLRPVLVLQIL